MMPCFFVMASFWTSTVMLLLKVPVCQFSQHSLSCSCCTHADGPRSCILSPSGTVVKPAASTAWCSSCVFFKFYLYTAETYCWRIWAVIAKHAFCAVAWAVGPYSICDTWSPGKGRIIFCAAETCINAPSLQNCSGKKIWPALAPQSGCAVCYAVSILCNTKLYCRMSMIAGICTKALVSVSMDCTPFLHLVLIVAIYRWHI